MSTEVLDINVDVSLAACLDSSRNADASGCEVVLKLVEYIHVVDTDVDIRSLSQTVEADHDVALRSEIREVDLLS